MKINVTQRPAGNLRNLPQDAVVCTRFLVRAIQWISSCGKERHLAVRTAGILRRFTDD